MRSGIRRLSVAVLLVPLLATACGGGGDSKGSGDSSLKATLNGSGSSFQNNLELAAIDAFTADNSGVTINYNSVGSGQGKTELASEVTDFAGTDSLVKPEEVAGFKGGELLYFPIASAPITVSYNLSGVNLQLTPATLAKIFGRKVKTWDDPAIAADNPDVTLPSTAITVVHRADGSGTTSNFTKYLAAAAPDDWTLGAGDTVAWPTDTQAGQKNTGVAQVVKQTAGAIGYVDFSDATTAGLTFASIKNKAGKFVEPTLDGASAAVAGATVNDDLTYSPLDPDGADSYPITAPTWILTYVNQGNAAKAKALKAYLKFVLTDGQDLAKDNGFAPLPDDLASKAVAQLDKIVVPGG